MDVSEAYDRKVRPVYDAIHAGNYKGALKLANAALSKYRGDPLFRALKAHALDRSGRTQEGLALCDELRKDTPTDEHVLHTLRLVYARAGRTAEVTAMYQAAAAAEPSNAALLEGVFAAHVREADLVKQQQVAMRLAKVASGQPGSERYLWWAVTSLLLQARRASAPGQAAAMAPKQLLQMADTLARKAAGPACDHYSNEALLLHVEVLRQQQRFKEAADLVAGPGKAAMPMHTEQRSLLASLLAEDGRLQAAAGLYRQMVEDNPDDWAVLQAFLDCLLPGSSASSAAAAAGRRQPGADQLSQSLAGQRLSDALVNGSEASSDGQLQAVLAGAEDTVADLQQRGHAAHLRGPILAAVELQVRRLRLAQADDAAVQDSRQLAAAIRNAYSQLATHVSCASDLRPYTAMVGSSSRQWLAEQIHQECQRLDAEGSDPIARLRRQVAAWEIEHDLGLPEFTDSAAAEVHAAQLLAAYADALQLSETMDPRDRGHGDQLVALAADTLLAAIPLQPSRGHTLRRMLQAVLVLEAGSQRRTVAAPMRLRATALYGLLGAPAPAIASFDALNIKHIQHDTISGHMMLPTLLGLSGGVVGSPSSTAERANGLLEEISQVHDHHDRDAGESIYTAFESGTYTKVLEFVAFGERLAGSHTRAVAAAEAALLKLRASVTRANTASSPTSAQLAALSAVATMSQHQDQLEGAKKMHFNEDVSQRMRWLPPTGAPSRLALTAWWDAHTAAASRPAGDTKSTAVDADAAAAEGAPAAADADSTSSLGCAQTSLSRCWWRTPGAAESAAAAPLQAQQRASLRERQLLPQLVAAMISGQAVAATGGGAHVLSAADKLAALHGVQPDDLFSSFSDDGNSVGSSSTGALEGGRSSNGPVSSSGGAARSTAGAAVLSSGQLPNAAMFGAGSATAPNGVATAAQSPTADAARPEPFEQLPMLRLLQLLHVAIFAADDAARRLHGEAPAEKETPEDAAQRRAQAALQLPGRLAALQAVLVAACERLVQQLGGAAGQLADGGALAGAALLAGEEAAWLRLALQAWAARLNSPPAAAKASKKGTSKKGSEAAAAAAAAAGSPSTSGTGFDMKQALLQLRDTAVGALHSLEAVLQDRLGQPLREQVAAVADLAGLTSAAHDGPVAQALWGWEPRLQARDVLQALVRSQRDSITAVAKELSERITSYSAISL